MKLIFREYFKEELVNEVEVASVREACSLCRAPQPDVYYTLNGVAIWDSILDDCDQQ